MREKREKVTEFSNNIFVSQFYYFLFNGVYSSNILKDYIEIEEAGIFRLEILKAHPNDSSDIILDLNERLIKIKNYFIENAHFKQKCNEDDLINFWRDYCFSQKILRVEGIRLYELSKLFDITELLKNGYFLQDVFCGYQSEYEYEYRSDCIDILHSAIYYYNEAYDYEIGNKSVLDYSQIDVKALRPNEFKRIFTANEVAYKNYREAYINLLFFIESFINAIGYNAILEPNHYTEEQVNRLHGFFIQKKNNYKKYSDIQTKIKDISRIISGVEIDVTISPYKDYIKGEVEIRNKYIHSSPFESKASLNYTRINWKEKCQLLIESFAMELIQKIWKHCYPNKRFPPFVYNGFYLGTFKGYQSKGVTAN